MKVKWIELEGYYTYETCYPKSPIIVSFNNNETQNMEYTIVKEKVKRYKEVIKEGEISIFYIFYISRYWLSYGFSFCLIKAIEDKFNCSVYKLLII